jgi:hypothetical protein
LKKLDGGWGMTKDMRAEGLEGCKWKAPVDVWIDV